MKITKPNNTKIIITVGPATESREMISSLLDHGVDVFRINTSHGDVQKHLDTIKLIREVEEDKKCNIPIMVDLQGPKIRLGILKEPILIEDNQQIFLTIDPENYPNYIPVDYPNITKDVLPNDYIYINDGKIKLKAIKVDNKNIECIALNGGELSSRKGINLPNTEVSTPAITDRDKEFIKFSVENNISYIALSFVRSEKDIIEAKEILRGYNKNIPIIAKIEKPQAVERIDAIIKETDGIMVARGDLGIELSPEKVPLVQKMIVKKANIAQKPVIIATQMLESMIVDPMPTRAEVNDVANSILDGTDAIMLSAETSVGKYPLKAVDVMERISEEIECSDLYRETMKNVIVDSKNKTTNVNHDLIISNLCNDLNLKAVIAVTDGDYTASILSKARIKFPIVAITNNKELCRQLNLFWGLVPLFFGVEEIVLNDVFLEKIGEKIIADTFLEKGDEVLFIAGLPYLDSEKTTMIRVFTL
jgi:pyruvate kinase